MADRMVRPARLFVWWESYTLLALSLADLAATVLLIRSGRAVEANPLLGVYLDYGLEWFLVVKAVLLCFIPIGMVDWIRERFPSKQARLRTILRVGLASYGALYVAGVCLANG